MAELLIANLMADSELGSPVSYSSFLVTIRLSRSVPEIFACDTQTDRQTDGRTDNSGHFYSWPPHCGGSLIFFPIYKYYLLVYYGCYCVRRISSSCKLAATSVVSNPVAMDYGALYIE